MTRAVRVEGHRAIRASVQRVWQLLSRLESHPRFANLWMAAALIDRSPSAPLVEFHGFFGGLPVTSVQRFSLRPPGRIEFRQVRGTLRELSGAYLVREAGGEVDLILHLAVDPGIPLFSEAAVQQILVTHISGTLAKIKASAERDLVRPPVRRGPAVAQGATAAAGEPAEAAPAAGDEPEEEPAEAATTGAEPMGEPAAAGRPPEGARRRRRRRRGRHRGGGQPAPPPAG